MTWRALIVPVAALACGLAACGDDGSPSSAAGDADAGAASDGFGSSDADDQAAAPVLARAVPDRVHALGGTVRLEGTGLVGASAVRLDGVDAAFVADGEALVVTVPPMTARTVTVEVTAPGGVAALEGGLFIEPLAPVWTLAPDWWAPDLGLGGATDLAAADTDGDGVIEVWVAGPGGVRQVTVAETRAIVTPIDGIAGAVGALVVDDFDADGFDDVFVCGGDAGATWVRGASTGAAIVPAAVPGRAGTCVDAAALGDGVVAAVSAGGGSLAVRRYVRASDGAWTLDETLEPAEVGDAPLGVASSTDEGATLEASRSSVLASAGAASGRFFYQLTSDGAEAAWRFDVARPAAPLVAVELALFGSVTGADLALALIDDGGRVEASLGADTEAAWRTLMAEGVAATEAWSGHPAAVELVVRPVAPVLGGEIFIDEIVGIDADGGRHVLETFERASFTTRWRGSRASLAVVYGGAGPTVFVAPGPDAACLGEVPLDGGEVLPVPVTSAEACAALATADVDDDGDGDLWIGVEAAQDRWWLNDGFGVWFDATMTTLPVDFADARGADFADLDLDGRLDLVVANAGETDRCYLASSAGRFEDHTPGCAFDTADTVDIVVADVSGDGAPDVMTLDAAGRLSLRLWTGDHP